MKWSTSCFARASSLKWLIISSILLVASISTMRPLKRGTLRFLLWLSACDCSNHAALPRVRACGFGVTIAIRALRRGLPTLHPCTFSFSAPSLAVPHTSGLSTLRQTQRHADRIASLNDSSIHPTLYDYIHPRGRLFTSSSTLRARNDRAGPREE